MALHRRRVTGAVGHGEPLPVSDERVSLRRLVAADLPAFQAYRRDEDLGRFQGWSPQSDGEALQFIVGMAEAPLSRDARFKGEACQEHTYVISRHGPEAGPT